MQTSNLAIFRPITLNTWHKVRVIRTGLEGSLQLDSDPFVTGRTPAPMTSLNLGEPLYIGGLRWEIDKYKASGITRIKQYQLYLFCEP